MSLHERTGTRDLTYSTWHRPKSIGRYLDKRKAARLKAIDIDFCEACNECNLPLALIETQRSSSKPKPATITTELAKLACIPAYSVSYMTGIVGGEEDILAFHVSPIWPTDNVRAVTTMTAQQYAEWLWSLRDNHRCERVA